MESAGHDTTLANMTQQLADLTIAVRQLQDEAATRTARPATPHPTPDPTPFRGLAAARLNPNRPEPTVPLPKTFSGDRNQYRSFITSCEVLFSLQPRTHHTDFIKIRTVIALLTGEPQAWAHQLLQNNHPALTSWSTFITSMNEIYDDPLRVSSAHAALRNLKQDHREVEYYISDFRRLSVDSTWNEPALLDQFRQGLSEAVKDELVRVDFPQSLTEAMSLCIKIDRRLRERRREKAEGRHRPKKHLPSPPLPPDEPMQIGISRPPLSGAEKTRRRTRGLCLYCGQSGHFVKDCNVRPLRESGRLMVASPSVTSTSICPSSHLMVPVSLQINDKNLPFKVMLDSGASGNFIDRDLIKTFCIPRRRKDHPIPIQLIDGSLIKSGPVVWETTPLTLRMGTEHTEQLSLDIVASPIFPIVLGLPWLRKHNPVINWTLGTLTLKSTFCKESCYPRLAATLSSAPTKVPEAYRSYSDVFEKKGADNLPPHRVYDCPVDLVQGAQIPYGRIFPLSEPELQTLRNYLDENLKKGFIRPSTSPAGAGIFFVTNKDGSIRPIVDYRAMNAVTIKNKYPLPLITELLDRLRDAVIFTKLDLRGAYNLVRVKAGHEWKTAFRTRYGHFEYLVMPFGLCNAPATFQHFINDVFRDILDVYVVAYLDDILIYSPSLDQHRVHVRQVLQRLRTHSLYAKLEKCLFEVSEVEFLGYVLSPHHVRMATKKVESILSWPVPKTKRQVQSFLGFSNFYRRFIRDFSREVRPLTALTGKERRFTWTDAAQKAFTRLKEKFTSAPILALPNPKLAYFLEVDASDSAAGAILSQRQGPKEALHPVAFFSKMFSPAEKNYDVSDRELLAVKLALEEWRHLLEGASFPVTVLTDHKNLEYLQKAKRLRARQARWSIFFTRFNLHFTYRPGSKNGKADALSRLHSIESPPPTESAPILPSSFFHATHKTLWEEISNSTSQNTPGEDASTPTQDRGVNLRKGRVVVPHSHVHEVLHLCHDTPLSGHGGRHQTRDLVKRHFWWSGMEKDIEDYVSTCAVCIRSKDSRFRPQGLLQPLPVPSRAWADLAMDFIVELPGSRGFDTILVVVDRLTKMGHFIATKGLPSAKETAELFIKEVVRLHGLPETITTDRGTQFTSRFWEALCQNLHISRLLSTAYHPRTNGQTERTNQTLEQYLRCYIANVQEEWWQFLPLAEFAFNNHIHRSTRLSPFFANYGFHPTMLPSSPVPSNTPGVENLLLSLSKNYQLLKNNLLRAQESYKRFFDRRHSPSPQYKAGDLVWLSTANIKLALPSKKLGPRLIGPFKVLEVISPTAMKLKLPESYRIHPVFHVSLLRPVVPDRFPHRSIPDAPGPVEIEGEEEYELQSILDSRIHYGHLQYLVSWKGYGPEENSWLPASGVHAPSLVRTFHLKYPQKPSPSTVPPHRTASRSSRLQPTAPRPRGRPRKLPLPTSSTPTDTPATAHRPRGRPRKLSLPTSSTPTDIPVTVPRPRGRPRKLSLPTSSTPTDTPTPVPRPRGRPKLSRSPSSSPSLDLVPVASPSRSPSPPNLSPLPQRPRRGRPRKQSSTQ